MEERAYKSHPFWKMRRCGFAGGVEKETFHSHHSSFQSLLQLFLRLVIFQMATGDRTATKIVSVSTLFPPNLLFSSCFRLYYRSSPSFPVSFPTSARPYFGPRPESRSDGTRGSQRMAAEQDLRGLDDEHDEHDELALD